MVGMVLIHKIIFVFVIRRLKIYYKKKKEKKTLYHWLYLPLWSWSLTFKS